MISATRAMPVATVLQRRSDEILERHQVSIWKQTDRLFSGLLLFQYVAGIAAAFWISPRTWEGLSSQPHPHVWAATLLGAIIISLPLYLAWKWPGNAITRHTIAAGQMLYSALLIHLCGGRIETHFHIFGSLAFLAFYRDWKVLITATVIVAVDHLIRGIYWPQSVFGVLTSSPWRALEHAGWVLFEDLFLIWSCDHTTREMRNIAEQQATLESTNELIETEVQQRTADLQTSQRDLLKSENAIRAIVDTAVDGIITIDALGAIQSANPAAEQLFGYLQGELIGHNVKMLMPTPYTDEHDGYLQNYLTSGVRKIIGIGREVVGQRRDGTTFPVDLAVSEVQTDGDRRFTGIVRDITARKAVESLAKSQAAAIDASQAVIEFALDGTILTANERFLSLTGYRKDELVGKHHRIFVDPEYAASQEYRQFWESLGHGEFQAGEFRRLGKNGVALWMQATYNPVVGADDKPVKVVKLATDITARKAAEGILAEQATLAAFAADIGRALVGEGTLKSALERCAEAMVSHLDAAFARIWTLNEADQILELQASAGLYTHIDGPHGRVPVGKFKIGLIAEERAPHLTNEVPDDPRVGDKDWARREGMVAFAGHPLIVQDRVVGVMALFARHTLSEGTLRALASVADSIAVGIERARSEEKLQEAMVAAEQASVAKSQFLANMSHELRTPMNAIIGYSEMLLEELEDLGQKEYLTDLQKIRAAGKHLLGLINDILDLSKIEAGKMEVFAEDFAVAHFLEEVVVTIQPLIEQKGNTLIVKSHENLGQAHSDQTKLRQILFNLLSNAAKFTEQGRITLQARRIDLEGRDFLELEVRDSGIGMTAEQLSKIFEAFTQAEASTTRRFGGTGLGLTITKRFCEILGGRLIVESEPGVGSSFTVQIPAQHGGSEPAIASTSSEQPPVTAPVDTPRSGREILVVDDDPTARDLMQRFLQKEGYTIRTASSGVEALELARKRRPMAITLDVMMPGMDGWAVLRALKEDPATAEIPVVMISMVDDAEMGYSLGVMDYLTKPPDRKRLSEILLRVRADQTPCQILIVDDDANNREMLAKLVKMTGCDIQEAQNGQEAMACIAERKPDLVLLDLMMPVMDGFEVVAELKRQGLSGQIPIVVLTAKDLTPDDRSRLEGQVQQIRNKVGVSRDELLREINAYLTRCCQDRPGTES